MAYTNLCLARGFFILVTLLSPVGASACRGFDDTGSNGSKSYPFRADSNQEKGGVMHKEKFIVSWSIDYGFEFFDEIENREGIPYEIISDELKKKLNDFFDNENLKNLVGKKIICDCRGRWIERAGIKTFEIHDGRIYAE